MRSAGPRHGDGGGGGADGSGFGLRGGVEIVCAFAGGGGRFDGVWMRGAPMGAVAYATAGAGRGEGCSDG